MSTRKVRLFDQIMLPSVKVRLLSLRADVIKALECAFHQAFTDTRFVAEHSFTRYNLKSSGLVVELNRVRIGYAHFTIALIDGYPPILCDASLRDGLPTRVSLTEIDFSAQHKRIS